MTLDSGHEPAIGGLGRSAARGGAVTMGGQLARIILQFGGIIILGRLLVPEDFGLIAMVVAIVGVGEVFRDFGLSAAAVQAKLLTAHQRDNLFWMNTGIGAVLGIIVFVFSWAISTFYGDVRLTAIAQVLATTFIFNGISTQYRADLNRRLRFTALVSIDVVAAAVGLAAAIIMAADGYQYWALVMQQAIPPVISLAALVAMTRWIPGPPHRRAQMGTLMRFGGNLVGVQLLTYVSKNVDSLIIGIFFGPTTLGIYDRAFQILMRPLNQINAPATRVALPVLSKLQDEKERFGAFILRGQSTMAHAVTFALAFAIAQAAPLFLLVLGPQWTDSAVLFQLLAVGGIMQVVSYATYWIFLAKGLTGSNLRYALITRPLLILAILFGSLWGVQGIAVAYSTALIIFWPFGLWWVGRASDAPVLKMFFNGTRAIGGYALCGLGSYVAVQLMPTTQPAVELAIGALAFTAIFGLVILAWPMFRHDVRDILKLGSYRKALPGAPVVKSAPCD